MFEFIRSHQRLMQGLLLLLIMPSFAFFGVQGFNSFREGNDGVASVAGQNISQQDLDGVIQGQLQRMQQMLGPNFDPKMLDTPEARQRALDTLIGQRVLQTQIIKDRMSVSNERVGDEIRNIPAVKNLYKPDGTIDAEAYDRLLASVGLSREQLFAQTRNQLLMREMTETIPSSTVLPQSALAHLGALLDQQRVVASLQFSPVPYLAKVELPADAAKKYYDTHQAEFETPETLSVQYVVLDQAAVDAHVQVTPAEIEAFYKLPANQARFVIPAQRRASHILIAVAKDAPAAERDKAKAKAQDILAKVRAKPGDFAALAKEFSQDPGSAEKGGDLDWAPAGNYVKPFSDALFALKDKEISDLVETEFGYHIIQLTGVREGSVQTLEQATPEITAQLRKQKGEAAFAAAAEDFSNIVYDQPDSLQPAADKLGLSIQTADGITRQPNPKATGPVNSPRVIDALFSSDVLKGKHNTSAIEVSPSTLVSARIVTDHVPALLPFDEARAGIVKKLSEQAAIKLARDDGTASLAGLEKSHNWAGFTAPQPVLRSAPGKISAAAMKQIFAADASKLPVLVGVAEPTGVYTIYRIDAIYAGQPGSNAAADANRNKQLATQVGELEFSAYLEGLKKRMKVKISKNAAALTDTPASSAP